MAVYKRTYKAYHRTANAGVVALYRADALWPLNIV